MRHRVATKRLGRPTDQRLAMLKNLVAAVLEHGYVTTTEVRAKQVRPIIEKVITAAREDTLNNRRYVRQWIPVGKAITTREQYENIHGEEPSHPGVLKGAERKPYGEVLLNRIFAEIGPKFTERTGGYLRLTKLGGISHRNAKGELTVRGSRRGDAASLVKIELTEIVD